VRRRGPAIGDRQGIKSREGDGVNESERDVVRRRHGWMYKEVALTLVDGRRWEWRGR
jgi:hypothetical protein